MESARIDGASEFWIFLRLILPLGLPAIASLAIFQFLWTWNDLIVALTFGQNVQPITVAIFSNLRAVRGQHRPDRAGVVHLAGRAARGVLRVPAVLRPGAARRAPSSRAMVARDGGDRRRRARRVRRACDAAARRGSRTSRCSMPAGATRRRRGGGGRSRSGSGGCAPRATGTACPTSFPGLAVRSALRRGSPWPLVQSVCGGYHPTVAEFLEHVDELRERTRVGRRGRRASDRAHPGGRRRLRGAASRRVPSRARRVRPSGAVDAGGAGGRPTRGARVRAARVRGRRGRGRRRDGGRDGVAERARGGGAGDVGSPP